MPAMGRYITSIVFCVGIVAFACGTASQSTVEPAAATQAKAHTPSRAESTSQDVVEPTSGGDDTTPAATPESQAEASIEQPQMDTAEARAAMRHKASPIEVLTGRQTAYLIDYDNSGAIAAANTACAEKAKKVESAAWAELAEKAAKEVREAKPKATPKANEAKTASPEKEKASEDVEAPRKEQKKPRTNPEDDEALQAAEAQEAAIAEKAEAVRTQCIRESRSKFEADVIRFRRDGLGHTQLVIYRRTGGSLKELYVANVALDDSSGTKVKVELKEAGIGKRPIMKDRNKFEVLVPNNYSIELEDAQFGKLPYNSKVGLVGN